MKNEDAKWVERVLIGDEEAFTALVKKYEKQIHTNERRWVKLNGFLRIVPVQVGEIGDTFDPQDRLAYHTHDI